MAPFIVNHPTLLNNWISARNIQFKENKRNKKYFKGMDRVIFRLFKKIN